MHDDDGLGYAYPSSDVRRGPTLQEILIALAVIAVVLIIVLWIADRQRANAEQLTCAGNLRQIGISLLQYTQDYDETVPNRLTSWPASVRDWPSQEAYTWRRAVSPYIKLSVTWQCPTNPRRGDPTGCETAPCGQPRTPDGFSVSYACNYNSATGRDNAAGDGYCGGKGSPSRQYSSFSSPAQLISVAEDTAPWSEFNVLKPSFAGTLFAGHAGTSNYLFADAHVAPLPPPATLSPTNLWRADNQDFRGPDSDAARKVLGVPP